MSPIQSLHFPMRHRLLLKLISIIAGTAALPRASAHHAQTPDTVVLLHGLARSSHSMMRLESSLRADGYRVLNLDYASTRNSISTLATQTLGPVFAQPSPHAHDSSPKVHIVTHSLGGILVRQFLHDHGVPANLGRIVMLAPPNQGSELADKLSSWWLYRRINGPAGLELGTDPASTPQRLGPLPPRIEVGVIAGSRSFNPLFSALIPGADDGKVSVARTHVSGETAHLTLPSSHTWLMWRKNVVQQIRAFLREGRFNLKTADEF